MKKVVILGGGPAGLTAAYELLKDTKDEYEVTILEESGVLGGISQTVRYHPLRTSLGRWMFTAEASLSVVRPRCAERYFS